MPTAARLEVRDKDKSKLRSWVRASGIRAGLAQRARIVLLAGDPSWLKLVPPLAMLINGDGARRSRRSWPKSIREGTCSTWCGRMEQLGTAGSAARCRQLGDAAFMRLDELRRVAVNLNAT